MTRSFPETKTGPRLGLASAAVTGCLAMVLLAGLPVRAQDANPVLAKVNGTEIRQSDVALAEEELGPSLAQMDPATKKDNVLSFLIDLRIVAKAAEDKKLENTEDFKKRLAFTRSRLLMDNLLATEGKAAVQVQLQDKAAAEDAVGVCTFASFGATQPEKLFPMYNACTGENLSLEGWMQAGDRIWNLERLFNNKAGLSRKDDSLPPRMTREPLTNGAVQNQVVELAPMLEEYYRLRGWDDDGNPSAAKLAELGIG